MLGVSFFKTSKVVLTDSKDGGEIQDVSEQHRLQSHTDPIRIVLADLTR